MPDVYLKRGRVKPLVYRHPWVFAASIDRVEGGRAEDGDIVSVRDPSGKFLARGFFPGRSQLRVRCFAWREGVEPDAAFFRGRLERAIAFRREALGLPDEATDCLRLVHGEADGLPGLIVDRYGEYVVMQVSSAGIEKRKDLVLDALEEAMTAPSRGPRPRAIYELDDPDSRAKEGLPPLACALRGDPAPDGRTSVREGGLAFEVLLGGGQKTGFFLDQRENRARVAGLARDRRVLDAFASTGAFAIRASKGGAARVVAVESSAPACEAARRNLERNGIAAAGTVEIVRDDVYRYLGDLRKRGEGPFDLVVLDPPKYAASRADVEKALKKYRELNALALEVVAAGGGARPGILVTCSCSHPVDDALFEAMLRAAAVEARRDVRIFERRSQAADHPVAVTCPESRYLKAFFCAVSPL